jgi:hypothetical protein
MSKGGIVPCQNSIPGQIGARGLVQNALCKLQEFFSIFEAESFVLSLSLSRGQRQPSLASLDI